MCEAFLEIVADRIIEKENIAEQRGLARGREEGLAEGQLMEREHNIQKYILNNLEENFSKEKITQSLQSIFELNTQQAEEYFEKYAYATK